MLVFTNRLRELIANDAPEEKIRQMAVSEGLITLPEAGMDRAIKGVTSVEEVLRTIQTDEDFGTVCSKCGEILNAEFIACPQCGHKVYETCPSCNKVLDDEWQFCPYCAHQAAKKAGPKEVKRQVNAF